MSKGKSYSELRSGFYAPSETSVTRSEEDVDLAHAGEEILGDYEYRTKSTDIREALERKRIYDEEKAESLQATKYGFSGGAGLYKLKSGEEYKNMELLTGSMGKYEVESDIVPGQMVEKTVQPFKYSAEYMEAGPLKRITMPDHSKITIDPRYQTKEGIDFDKLKTETGIDFSKNKRLLEKMEWQVTGEDELVHFTDSSPQSAWQKFTSPEKPKGLFTKPKVIETVPSTKGAPGYEKYTKEFDALRSLGTLSDFYTLGTAKDTDAKKMAAASLGIKGAQALGFLTGPVGATLSTLLPLGGLGKK